MSNSIVDLLSDEKVMEEFLAEANKAAAENPENCEAGIKKLQDFCVAKGIKDCSIEDVKKVLSLIKETTEKTGNKKEPLTADEEENIVAGYCCGQDFDYKGEGKYWKKLIRNIAIATTATVGACSLLIGGTVLGVKKLSQ